MIGAALAALAVGWFWIAYPDHWAGYGLDRTLPISALYLLGLALMTVGLLIGVAGFRTRNAPVRTVSLSVLRKEIRIVDREEPCASAEGSIGLFGDLDARPTPRVDGGTTTVEPDSPRPVDAYCGNCRTSSTLLMGATRPVLRVSRIADGCLQVVDWEGVVRNEQTPRPIERARARILWLNLGLIFV